MNQRPHGFLPLEWLIIITVLIFVIRTQLNSCFQSLSTTKNCSEIFQSIGIGLGSILGGAGGLKLILDWAEQQIIKLKIKNFHSLFPRNRLNIDFRIIEDPGHPGTMYVLDLRNNSRRWIRNQQTFRDIGFWYQDATPITQHNFDQLNEGDFMFTREDPL